MASKQVITDEERQSLIALLPDDLAEKVRSGEYSVFNGQNPEKPVVTETASGKLVKGSGRWPGANDPAATGRRYGYKNSRTYQEAIQKLIPVDGDVTEKGSFAWLLQQGFDAAEGSPVNFTCPECGFKGLHKSKKDTNAIIKLIEMVHGRATESKEITVEDRKLIEILTAEVNLNELAVHDISDEETNRRREFLEGEMARRDN